jgi:hypothetical protein
VAAAYSSDIFIFSGAVVGVDGGAVDGQCNVLPGLVVVEGALEAVSVSVELLSLSSSGLFFVLTSILLDSLWVLSDTVTAVLWDLARAVLVAVISRSARALVSVLLGHNGDNLGDSGAVFSVLVTQQLLRLVPGLLNDDSVADVEDCFSSISSTLLLSATPSVSSSMFPNYWGSFS